MGIKCLECSELLIPPRIICPKCKGKKFDWIEFKGDGIIRTFTILHVAPTKLKDIAPYIIGIVELDEGPLITGRISNFGSDNPQNIKIGMRVRVDFIKESEKTILAFKPNE